MSFSDPIDPEHLRRRFGDEALAFHTTAELEDMLEPVGQERALAALRFGLGMRHAGYNLFCTGAAGSGKRTLLRRLLRERAAADAVPQDWCYVHDFGDGRQPRALRLPPGRGVALAADLERLVNDLRSVLPATLAGEGQPARLQVALEDLLAPMVASYGDLPVVLDHLERVRSDVAAQGRALLHACDGGAPATPDPWSRYRVNVLVEHSMARGAPVVFEDAPQGCNLGGWWEYRPLAGGMVTDFTLIRAGALHRANGGYLVLDARRLTDDRAAWEALKRALDAGQIHMDASDCKGMVGPRPLSLAPQPIALDVKIVLVGERALYYQLYDNDPAFPSLFKVMADFEDECVADPPHVSDYARMIATVARRHGLLDLDRGAVARVLEQAARRAEDRERLDTHVGDLTDLLQEADHYARQRNAASVARADVQRAIDQQRHRAARVQEGIYDEIVRGSLLIDTSGARTGQVNGVSIIELGDHAFGQPNRISATARLGEGEIVDIERETELGGSFHSKGVLILAAYLAHRYCADKPFSLAASIAFEQSYAMIDGDSASVAELCALLSALAQVPIRQHLAVTGSVNQHGEVQAIGGVNEKIEAFFDICAARGLSGDQGVLIPRTNIANLMLREDVVQAAAQRRFAVYAVDHVDQAAELLTGLRAGVADHEGVFPEGSLNRRIADRLNALAEIRHEFSKAGDGGGADEDDDGDDGDGD